MKRRGFLKALGAVAAAPLIVNAELAAVPASPKRQWGGDVVLATDTDLQMCRDTAGNTYRYIRATRAIKKNEMVCLRPNEPFGVAPCDIDQGNYGFIQVGGPATVKLKI